MSIEQPFRSSSRRPDMEPVQATFSHWNPDRGFGFLRTASDEKVFCHRSVLCVHIRPPAGQGVDLRRRVHVRGIDKKERGLAARKVECDECAAPEKWELQQTGPEYFGEREWAAVCTNHRFPRLPSPIPYQEVEKANVAFRRAEQKYQLWQGEINERFFSEFGLPQEVRATESGDVILKYPHGEKLVWASAIINSKRWEVTFSGEWRKQSKAIEAKIIFPGIPGLLVWRVVARLNIYPELEQEFDLLPKDTQEQILQQIKKDVPLPEDSAEKNFAASVNFEINKRKIENLYKDIYWLQAPGDMAIYSRSSQREEEQYDGDGEATGLFLKVDYQDHFLRVGGRKNESNTRLLGALFEVNGGYDISISKPQNGETREDVRDRVLLEKRQQLCEMFDSWLIHRVSFEEDKRLPIISQEIWINRYNARMNQLREKFLAKLEAENDRSLASARESWRQYEEAAKELKKIQAEVQEINSRAELARIDGLRESSIGAIGSVDLATIQQEIEVLRLYVAEIEQKIKAAREKEESIGVSIRGQQEVGIKDGEWRKSEPEKDFRRIAHLFFNVVDRRIGKRFRQGVFKNAASLKDPFEAREMILRCVRDSRYDYMGPFVDSSGFSDMSDPNEVKTVIKYLLG